MNFRSGKTLYAGLKGSIKIVGEFSNVGGRRPVFERKTDWIWAMEPNFRTQTRFGKSGDRALDFEHNNAEDHQFASVLVMSYPHRHGDYCAQKLKLTAYIVMEDKL